MHPECELVAIIGKPARRVAADDALDYVGGYTIACDYAIREYLENYYRPNLRGEEPRRHDAAGSLDRRCCRYCAIPRICGCARPSMASLVQEGSTADMILDVAGLIAYLSETMTLVAG